MKAHQNYILFFLLFITLCFPLQTLAELPDADNKPFWTEKSSYVEGGYIFGVGVSMNKKSLEEARKASFKAGAWEIANYAQLSDTTMLFVETQMNYDELNKDGTYTVWRLVKVSQKVLKNTKKALGSNNSVYIDLADKIKLLEKDLQFEKADALRKAIGMGKSIDELKNELKVLDKRLTTIEKKVEELTDLFNDLKFRGDNIERISEGEINWTRKLIRAKGFGIPNPKMPLPARKKGALRAAQINAQTRLIEFVNGLVVESTTFMNKHQVDSDVKITEIKGRIKGAYTVGDPTWFEDNSVEILMEVDVRNVLTE